MNRPLGRPQISATAFLRQYADNTSGSSNRSLLIVCLWLAITFGRIIGLRDQRTLTLAPLYRHAAAVGVGGASVMLVLLVSSRSTAMLWVTVVAFGLFSGPALGYGYDMSTRVSPNPAASTMVAQFGITAGARYETFLDIIILRRSCEEQKSCRIHPRSFTEVFFVQECTAVVLHSTAVHPAWDTTAYHRFEFV